MNCYCDNKGVVNHANALKYPLPEKQEQADLLTLLKQYARELSFTVEYEHVYGHMDDIIPWEQLSVPEQLNILMDKYAKDALLRDLANSMFIDQVFPFEQIVISCGNKRASASPMKEIKNW